MPDKKIPGELLLAANGEATLELQGSFQEDHFWESKPFNTALVLGLTNSGQEITLHQCYQIHSTHSFAGYPTSEFRALTVFVGVHFEDEAKIRFRSVTVRFAHLDEWVNRDDFRVEATLFRNEPT